MTHKLLSIDLERVANVIRDVAEVEILPRFRNLKAGDTREKSPGDYVTIADESAEIALASRLMDLLPGSVVVGEEATAKDPTVMNALAEIAPAWVIDPIDGTANFAAGREGFVCMLALVQADDILASWIYHPISKQMTMAEQGSGVFINGAKANSFIPTELPKGVLAYGMRGVAGIAEQIDMQRHRLNQVKSARSAGIDYVRMAKGEIDFTFFSGVMPWDHAPGALIIRELGGQISYVKSDGTYKPSQAYSRAGVLSATNSKLWHSTHEILFGST